MYESLVRLYNGGGTGRQYNGYEGTYVRTHGVNSVLLYHIPTYSKPGFAGSPAEFVITVWYVTYTYTLHPHKHSHASV